NQHAACAFVRQYCVGHDRGGMRQQTYLSSGDLMLTQCDGQRLHDTLAEVAWRCGNFGDANPPVTVVDQGDVGKRAADVDADSPSYLCYSIV
ncbi:MAG: hypothetical protein ACI8W7_004635, partial [Gammaproteobacteria bacterium]